MVRDIEGQVFGKYLIGRIINYVEKMDVWKQGLGCHSDSSNIQNERKSRHVCILKTIGEPMPSQLKKKHQQMHKNWTSTYR